MKKILHLLQITSKINKKLTEELLQRVLEINNGVLKEHTHLSISSSLFKISI